MTPIKLLNKTSFKIGVKLLLRTLGCGSFVTVIAMFVADMIYIAILSPFIHKLQSKMNANTKVNALKHAVKGTVSIKDYVKARNGFNNKGSK